MVRRYNDPLADAIAARLTPNELLTVGAFYKVALHLDGMPELEIPDGVPASGGTPWRSAIFIATGGTSARFDTIIVDEAQDLAPPGWRSWSNDSTAAVRGA